MNFVNNHPRDTNVASGGLHVNLHFMLTTRKPQGRPQSQTLSPTRPTAPPTSSSELAPRSHQDRRPPGSPPGVREVLPTCLEKWTASAWSLSIVVLAGSARGVVRINTGQLIALKTSEIVLICHLTYLLSSMK